MLKEIGRKIAQVFRRAKAADEKAASSIATSLDAIAERMREYEKRFEPEPPEPDPPQEINAAPPFTFEFYLAGIPIAQAMAAAARCSSDEMVSAILKVIAQLFCRHHGEWFRRQEPYFNLSGETQYKVCTKCGKKLDERFVRNFDGS